MNYKKYTDGVIFIDDKQEEVDEAICYFNQQNIKTIFFNPLDVPSNLSCSGYNFIFLDLSYDGNVDIKTAVVALNRVAEIGEKHFIVVAWTQHEEDIENLQDEIHKKMSGCYPLKVLNGEKFKILNRGEGVDFEVAFSAILDELERDNPLLFKLLEWKKNMICAVNENFNKLVEKSYDGGIVNLHKSLGLLANKSLSKYSMLSALDTLNNMVNDSAINKLNEMEDFLLKYDESEISIDEKMFYNFEFLFSEITISSDVPGSIYKVGPENKYNMIKKSYETKKQNDKVLLQTELYYESLNESKIGFESITPVKVNITPNCTFASSNTKNTTYLDGIIIKNIEKDKIDKINKMGLFKNNGGIFYKYMDKSQKICVLKIFPEKCSYELEVGKKIYQLNNNVKVEIQHLFGSWVSRVGNILY